MEEKVDSNIGFEGSNHDRNCHFCKVFRTSKTDDSYVYYRRKTIKTMGFDRFWRIKIDKNRQFLCLNPKKILQMGTKVVSFGCSS